MLSMTSQDNIGEGFLVLIQKIHRKMGDFMLVYVLSKNNVPLMPCSPRKARILLKEGKASVVNRTPFTIKLKYGSSGYKQEITLGVDAGSKVIGLSATTEKKELFTGECHLRNDIVRLISSRRALRVTRRAQKTRYRKSRFLNRVSTKKNGWMAPSVVNKIQTHIKVIENIHRILPITKIIVEVASFDIQKIKNPDISGTDYQEGNQLGFWNVREYVLFRDGHKCQACKGSTKDKILNVHHIESRKTGGNAPNNLITLCETCHNNHHSGEIKLKLKRGKSFRDAAFMGIMKWKLLDELSLVFPNVEKTYGYITKSSRIASKIEKSHINDAFCIAGNFRAVRKDNFIKMRKVRSHDRMLHKTCFAKGGKNIKTRGNYIVHGFRNFDVVKTPRGIGFITTRRKDGDFVVSNAEKDKVYRGNCKNIQLLIKPTNILMEDCKNR